MTPDEYALVVPVAFAPALLGQRQGRRSRSRAYLRLLRPVLAGDRLQAFAPRLVQFVHGYDVLLVWNGATAASMLWQRPSGDDVGLVRSMLGFEDINCARRLIVGIETMHMVKNGQLNCTQGQALSAADQFYSLAF